MLIAKGQMAVCCQNLPLGALSSRSAPLCCLASYLKSSVFFEHGCIWLALFEYSAWQTWCTGDTRNLFSVENLFKSWLGYQWASLRLLIACNPMLGWYRKTAATTPMSIAVIFPSVLFSVYQPEIKCLIRRPAKCGIREDFPGMFVIQFSQKLIPVAPIFIS
jgi:hypothetical protein